MKTKHKLQKEQKRAERHKDWLRELTKYKMEKKIKVIFKLRTAIQCT